MSKQPPIVCPFCGNRRGIARIADTLKCPKCMMLFDSAPGEGGDYYNDPTKRIEKEEDLRLRKIERMKKRRTRGMSICIECLEEMHPCDAAESLICGKCRHAKKTAPRIKTITGQNSEQVGRRSRSSQSLGGTCEMNNDGDAE